MCQGLSDFGATVYVLGRSEEKFSHRFDHGDKAIRFKRCDISNTVDIQQSFSEVFEEHQAIDILVNNAAYVRGQGPLDISDDDWKDTVDGVLNSIYRCIREVTPYFLMRSRGKLINISSMYGVVSPDFRIYDDSPEFLNPPHYGAAKAAVIQLTKYFAQYLGPHNIQVNCISPGPFPSDSVQQDKKFVQALENRTSLGRIGKPEDLVGAVVYLSSAAADFVTGHNLAVDGGWTIS